VGRDGNGNIVDGDEDGLYLVDGLLEMAIWWMETTRYFVVGDENGSS
jgi:hypothetical protein